MTDMTIAAPLAAALSAKGYDALTAVQTAVLAEGVAGRDLLVSAQTGSGKTVVMNFLAAQAQPDAAGRAQVVDARMQHGELDVATARGFGGENLDISPPNFHHALATWLANSVVNTTNPPVTFSAPNCARHL